MNENVNKKRRSRLNVEDYIGMRIGTRIIISRCENISGRIAVLVKCDCGSENKVVLKDLLKGEALTCRTCAKKNQTGPDSIGWRGGVYISATLYNHWRRSAIRRNIEWTIDIDYLDNLIESQNFKCVFTGEKLTIGHGERNGLTVNGSASLDRIDSLKGYLPGNIQFVIKEINKAKQAVTDEQFIELCRKVVKYKGL
jgi:hypothetical protein